MTGHYYDIFNDTCYLFVDELAYWIDADQYCYDMGGELVQVTYENLPMQYTDNL